MTDTGDISPVVCFTKTGRHLDVLVDLCAFDDEFYGSRTQPGPGGRYEDSETLKHKYGLTIMQQ